MAVSFGKADPVSEVILKKLRYGFATTLGTTALESMRLNVRDTPDFLDRLLTATFDVLGDTILEDRYITYFSWRVPKTWFQHLKEAHAPRWFLSRYPVAYEHKKAKRTVKFTRMAQYPKANVAIKKDTPLFIKTLGGLEVIKDSIEEFTSEQGKFNDTWGGGDGR